MSAASDARARGGAVADRSDPARGLDVTLRTTVGTLALDVALAVAAGRCLALAGPSGAGKTSVLRAIAGLLRPREGRIVCGPETWLDTARGIAVPPERRRCGLVFQDYALFGHMSAWRNVAYALRHVPRRRRRAEARALLARFGIDGPRLDARPARLSGGERQRVALARTLAARPRAMLLDEPLAALDARTRHHAGRELIAVLRELEVPAVLVTHDFGEAARLGDEVAVLDGGRIVQRGSASELAARPASPFVADFTGASVLTGVARPVGGGLTAVALDGGGTVLATDVAVGAVAVAVHPWDVAIEPASATDGGSSRNRLVAQVATVTVIGNRVRVGLALPQPLVAEITRPALERLALAPGARVVASWKASATRLVPR